MAKIIKQALHGQRDAMKELYKANKQKVFYLAEKLLLDKEQAQGAVQWVWEQVWSNGAEAGIDSEEGFTQYVVKLVVSYCKKQIEKENIQSFVAECSEVFDVKCKAEKAEYSVDFVLSQLPQLQRVSMIARKVGGMNKVQLAAIFKMERYTIEKSWEEEERNVEMVLEALFNGQEHSYDSLMKELAMQEKDCVVPESVDKAAMMVIDEISAQAEKTGKKKDLVYAALFLVIGVLVLGGMFRSRLLKDASQGTDSSDIVAAESTEISEAEEETIVVNVELLDENLTYYADIEMKDYGTIVVELNQEAAPITAANFVELAESGFYDGLTFHRILKGYMMQGGDPKGDGTGTSGKTIYGEFAANGYKNTISHTRGTISMARPDDYNGASCQFFIMQGDYALWNGYYAAFGTVVEGMEVVDAICDAGLTADGNGVVNADEQPVINKITIRTEAAAENTAE